MTIPNGIRAESIRIPNASRAGALHSTPRYVTPHHAVVLPHRMNPTFSRETTPVDNRPSHPAMRCEEER